jgi:hypothetical protein
MKAIAAILLFAIAISIYGFYIETKNKRIYKSCWLITNNKDNHNNQHDRYYCLLDVHNFLADWSY